MRDQDEDPFRDKTYLGRDELQPRELTPCLSLDEVSNFRIDLFQWLVQSFVLNQVKERQPVMLGWQLVVTTYEVCRDRNIGHCSSGDRYERKCDFLRW